MANQLQNKLNQFEVLPPEGLWEKITDQLDNQQHSFVERLQNFEVPPPDQWEKIEARLESEQSPNVSFFNRYKKLFVYSGAAAAIIVIVVLVTLLIPARGVSDETAGNKLITQGTVQNEQSSNGDNKVAKEDGRYITLLKDDGKKVRMSKKVLSVYTCATKDVSERCKKQLRQLQEKMASSMVAPTVDFTGFVELVKDLNEDQ